MERSELKLVLESLLFSSEVPIRIERLHEVFPDLLQKELRDMVLELKAEYDGLGRSIHIREVANGFQLCSKPEYSEWIRKLKKTRSPRLGSATMETLAIVAYKQPVSRAEVDEIRGVDSGGILRSLLEKKLIRIVGKKEAPGRPLLYGTTPKFLITFGLKGLKDLPTLEELGQLQQMSLPLSSENPQDDSEASVPSVVVPDDDEGA